MDCMDYANYGEVDTVNQAIADNADTSRYLRFTKEAMSLPPIDIADSTQVEERIRWYIQYCIDRNQVPNVSGVCCVLGIDRKTLYRWEHGVHRTSTHKSVIQKYKRLLEAIWESQMVEGTINPIVGIFLGKNNFDYADKQELVVSPESPLGEVRNADEIRQRYDDSIEAELPSSNE